MLSDLDIMSCHSVLLFLNFSSNSELLIMNVVRDEICGDEDVEE